MATGADLEVATACLAEAFVDYSWVTYQFPERNRGTRVERAYRAFLELVAIPHLRVWVTDDLSAIAVWTSPSAVVPQHALDELRDQTRALQGPRSEAATFAQRAIEVHRPATPYWLLAVVAVTRARRGQGLGKRVLEPGLRAAEAEGLPVMVETSTPENVALYEHLGFQVVASTVISSELSVWSLRR